MNKIRITKDENGAVILRFEKREDCERYTVSDVRTADSNFS